jgi:hypothetical protein
MRTTPGRFRRLAAVTTALIAFVALVASNAATGQTPEKKSDTKEAPGTPQKEIPPKSPGTGGSGGSVTDADVIAYINQMIEDGWKDNKITPSRFASDHEWLRRVYLDLVGRVPSVQEINDFFSGHNPATGFGLGKSRAALLKGIAPTDSDKGHPGLLVHEDYAKNWANLWTVWLLTRTSPPGIDREKMRFWIEESFATNKPYDKFVYEILTATGKCDENGAANFVASHVGEMNPTGERSRFGTYEMVPVTSRTTKLFLGVQTQCTQCHNHPFIDERKQNQYWGINAFFRQVEREPATIGMQRNNQVDRRYTLKDNLQANSELGVFFEQRNGLLLRTSPTYLNGAKLDLGSKESPHQVNRRVELAKLLTKDPYFAKEIVNRMWAHYMGRGFTNPVDDFGEHNPPSHPELLDKLAQDFTTVGFNLQRLAYWITISKPYALSSVANNTNLKSDTDQYFSRMLLKSMTPEQLVDSIFTATNAEQTKSSKEERRKLYDDWMKDFTVNFGDDEGNEATFNGTVVQALLLMNGNKLNEATKMKPGSTAARASTMGGTNGVNHLFLAALGRPASGAEISKVRALASAGKDPLQDVLWALLNSNEFILNH